MQMGVNASRYDFNLVLRLFRIACTVELLFEQGLQGIMQHYVNHWHNDVRKTQTIKKRAHAKPRLGTLRSSLPKKGSNQGPTQLCISKAGPRLEQLNEKHKGPTKKDYFGE